jgi:hypothetical protein
VGSFFFFVSDFCVLALSPLTPMRKKLARDEGVRKKFTATFSRLGKKVNYSGYSEDTILLVDIRDAISGEPVANHLWFSYTKSFEKVRLEPGAQLEFVARVKEYSKGYVNRPLGVNQKRRDFKLSHPTQVKITHPL